MQVLQSQDYFPDVDSHRVLGKVIPLVQMGKHLPTAHVVCTHTQTGAGVNAHAATQSHGNLSAILHHQLPRLTQDEVQLALGLKGVVKRDQEGRLTDVLQNLPLSASVFCCLCFLNDGCFFQDLEEQQIKYHWDQDIFSES